MADFGVERNSRCAGFQPSSALIAPDPAQLLRTMASSYFVVTKKTCNEKNY